MSKLIRTESTVNYSSIPPLMLFGTKPRSQENHFLAEYFKERLSSTDFRHFSNEKIILKSVLSYEYNQ